MAENFLVWLGIFVFLALLATVPVHLHLRSMAKGGGGGEAQRRARPSKPRSTRPCPRCGHGTSRESAFCEKCGVPMMLWQLKESREVTGRGKADRGSRTIPIIAQDLCIGCSACVNACGKDVLEIVAGKSTVTNLQACTGAADCAEACPTGACQLTGGGAARRVEVPQIGAQFETNVPGIYAIGELGGLGLIKNAVNEGQLVIEALKRKHVPRPGVVDFIIVGAGPAGLSASLAAKEAGLQALVFEQGSFADTIRRFPNKKIVMAEPVRVPMYGSLWISDAPKETLLSVWQTIIQSAGVEIRENEQVAGVTKTAGGLFLVETTKGRYQAQRVILAIGKRGTPRKLEIQGSELPKLMYSLADAAQYKHAKILIVGGGDSSAEAAIGLANQEGNEVTLSYRKRELTRPKEKNMKALKEAIARNKVRFLPASELLEVRAQDVTVRAENGSPLTLANDYIFAFIGGKLPNAFLAKLGIAIVTKEVSLAPEKIPA